MKKAKKIKCGGFLYKDGVVIRRPGKHLRFPNSSETDTMVSMYVPSPMPFWDTDLSGTNPSFISDRWSVITRQNVVTSNPLQDRILATYISLKTLYYVAQLKKGIKKAARCASQAVGKLIDGLVREYE